jgi:PAX-interacting protein 1
MINQIRNIAEEEQYSTKSLSNNVIKINCVTPETYRTFIRHLKENNIYYHTYQLKEEGAYRIVIKHLHHSTDIEEIRQELLELGHKARNILNAQHRITKEPLNAFFIDLEPAENNKDVYTITALRNKIIQIEPPRAIKNNIVQCIRCQQYGHKKSYCNRPFACVKCGGHHNSKECTKSKDTPATCALCGDNHPANYRGCEHYHNILKESNTHRNIAQRAQPTHTNTNDNTIQPNGNLQQSRSYTEVARNNTHQFEDTATTLTKCIEEFKGLFNQLLQQNSMILSMLTKLINKND